MASLKVVVVDVVANSGPGFLDVVPFRQVGFLILEGPEPPLDPDVVSPTALAIHALAYMVLLEEFFVLLAGKLADLLCVSCLLFAFLGEFFFQVFLPGVVKDHRSFLKEFLLPVPEEVRLNVIFGSNDVQFLFPPFRTSRTRSDLNSALKSLLVRDMFLNPPYWLF